MANKYKLRFEWECHPAGTIVYPCAKPDYGCAGDDTRYTGEEHISVTLKSDGDYPFFTIPCDMLEVYL